MAITNGYCTLNELKAFVTVAVADTNHDGDLERAVESASRMIDNYCGRIFYDSGSATAKTFKPDSPFYVEVPDFSTTTGLVVKTDTSDDGTFDITWDAGDFQVEPTSSVFGGRPYNRITAVESRTFPTAGRRTRVEITARWGWTAVPTDVEQTCLIVAGELWRRKEAPFGVAGFGPDGAVRVGSTEIPMLARLNHYRPVLVW
jgi:hypothetical protein